MDGTRPHGPGAARRAGAWRARGARGSASTTNAHGVRRPFVKLAIHLSYSGAKLSIDTERIREAERLGYDSIWTAEAYGSDAVVPAAWIAAHTSRIHVGTAIMQIAGRTPAMTAMTAMTLDALSNGRFRLGLGVSGPQVVEGWHGEPFGKPLRKTREYVDVVRAIFRREKPVEFRGDYY